MADVSKITGPSGAPEPPSEKKKKEVASFKEMMKIAEGGIDADEQKKRKKERAEEEAEEKAKEEAALTEGPVPGAPSILTSPKGAPPTFKAPAIEEAPPPTRAPSAPSPYEVSREEEVRLTPEPEEAPPPPRPRDVPRAGAPHIERPKTPEEKRAEEAKKEEAAKAKPIAKKEAKKEAEMPAFEAKPEEALTEEEKKALFPKAPEGKTEEELKKAEEAIEEIAPITPTQALAEAKKKAEEEEKKIKEQAPAAAIAKETPAAPPLLDLSAVPKAPTPLYSVFHNPQILDLFDRMVGTITVITTTGVQETVVKLDAPQFANSPFYNMEISIQEFPTAPKVFNVQILGTPQAIALYNENAADLMAAFQAGKYNFKINRIETGLLGVDRPWVRRKERPSKEKGKEK